MAWNLDANVEDADWPKKHWDLGGPGRIQYVLETVIAGGFPKDKATLQQRLTSFMATPSGLAMPQAHRDRLRALGYAVPDKTD